MTPQERQLVDDLFDRLSKVEAAPRDADAVAAINEGLRKAPNAVYALVQTVLLQDEALKRANARIQELEAHGGPEQQQSGGFLDSMRDAIFGQGQPRGSVPSVPPREATSRPVWNSGQALQQSQGPGPYNQPPYGQPYGAPQAPMGGGVEDRRPWSDQSGGNLARDAGINDIGSSGNRTEDNSRAGLFDSASNDDTDSSDDQDDMDVDSDDFGGDGDSDYA